MDFLTFNRISNHSICNTEHSTKQLPTLPYETVKKTALYVQERYYYYALYKSMILTY